jgi:hypothetical protein
MPPVQQREEIGLAVTAGSDQFAVDDAGLRRQPEDGRGDPREAAPLFRPNWVELAPAL